MKVLQSRVYRFSFVHLFVCLFVRLFVFRLVWQATLKNAINATRANCYTKPLRRESTVCALPVMCPTRHMSPKFSHAKSHSWYIKGRQRPNSAVIYNRSEERLFVHDQELATPGFAVWNHLTLDPNISAPTHWQVKIGGAEKNIGHEYIDQP